MTAQHIFELARMVAVIALVVLAAALATPKGRLPLALRGLAKIVRRDAGWPTAGGERVPVSARRRMLAFALVLAAAVLALA